MRDWPIRDGKGLLPWLCAKDTGDGGMLSDGLVLCCLAWGSRMVLRTMRDCCQVFCGTLSFESSRPEHWQT
eukprot:1708517-Amphidinium_carterae.1